MTIFSPFDALSLCNISVGSCNITDPFLHPFQMSSTSYIGQLLAENLNEHNFVDVVTTDQISFDIKVDCVSYYKRRANRTFDVVVSLNQIFRSDAQDNVRLIALHIMRKTEDSSLCVNLLFDALTDCAGDVSSMSKILKFAQSVELAEEFICQNWSKTLDIVAKYSELSFLLQICSCVRALSREQFQDLESLSRSLNGIGEDDIFLQILSQFRVDASLPIQLATSTHVWKVILCGLRSDRIHSRKRAIYLLKRLSDYCLKSNQELPEAYKVGSQLSNIILLFDTLEETQVHLIEPVYNKFQKVFEGFKGKKSSML